MSSELERQSVWLEGIISVSGLGAEHLWVLLNPRYLEKAVPYIQDTKTIKH
jgi:hypothetical protein